MKLNITGSPIRMLFIHIYVPGISSCKIYKSTHTCNCFENYTLINYAPNLGVFVLFLLNSTLELIQLILVSFFEIVHLFLMLGYNNLLLCVEVLQHLGFLMLQSHLQFHCLQNTAKNAFQATFFLISNVCTINETYSINKESTEKY